MLVADKESRLIGGCTYIKIECVKLIYEVLNVKMMSDLDIQSFFNLLKKSSEDLGFAIQEVREHEDDDDYEEYIEISVCSELIAHFLKGANKILKQIGYSHALL